MTHSTHVRSNGRGIAVAIAGLTVALLTPRVSAGAETVVHQTSGGRSAYVDSYTWDDCGDQYVSAIPSTYRMVAKAPGGGTTVTNGATMNMAAGGNNYCTGTYWFAVLDAVTLTPSAFHLDPALNEATLQGTATASWGYLWNYSDWEFTDLAGAPVSFAIHWQGTGADATPPHSPTHRHGGGVIVNVNATDTTREAVATGWVSAGSNTASTGEYQWAFLSQNLSVSTFIKRSTPIIIRAGQTVTLSNATLNACDPLTYGYQLNAGALVQVGSKTWFCGTQPVADVTIGPFAQATELRIWLRDQSASYCGGYPDNFTFFSDGFHGLVSGKDPWQVDIMDSGVGCSSPADQIRLPDAPGLGNLNVTVVTGS